MQTMGQCNQQPEEVKSYERSMLAESLGLQSYGKVTQMVIVVAIVFVALTIVDRMRGDSLPILDKPMASLLRTSILVGVVVPMVFEQIQSASRGEAVEIQKIVVSVALTIALLFVDPDMILGEPIYDMPGALKKALGVSEMRPLRRPLPAMNIATSMGQMDMY